LLSHTDAEVLHDVLTKKYAVDALVVDMSQ
jgi:hypothetical protein